MNVEVIQWLKLTSGTGKIPSRIGHLGFFSEEAQMLSHYSFHCLYDSVAEHQRRNPHSQKNSKQSMNRKREIDRTSVGDISETFLVGSRGYDLVSFRR
jgi:hypothetical protein